MFPGPGVSNDYGPLPNNIIEQQSFVEMKHTHIVSHFLPKVIFILIGAVAWQDLHLEMVTARSTAWCPANYN